MTQADLISAALAEADAETQAAIFNEFVRCLTVICKHSPLGGGRSMQSFYIAERLTEESREFFHELVADYDTTRESSLRTVLDIDARRRELAGLDARIQQRLQMLGEQ